MFNISVYLRSSVDLYYYPLRGLYSACRKKGAEAPFILTIPLPVTSVDNISVAAPGSGASGNHVGQNHHQNPCGQNLQA
jgi:hypothetical protein